MYVGQKIKDFSSKNTYEKKIKEIQFNWKPDRCYH